MNKYIWLIGESFISNCKEKGSMERSTAYTGYIYRIHGYSLYISDRGQDNQHTACVCGMNQYMSHQTKGISRQESVGNLLFKLANEE